LQGDQNQNEIPFVYVISLLGEEWRGVCGDLGSMEIGHPTLVNFQTVLDLIAQHDALPIDHHASRITRVAPIERCPSMTVAAIASRYAYRGER